MNPKGMTLIEVILAISILSIIAITFLPIITGSFSNIVKAGNKTRQVYDTKGKIEEAMANKQSIEMDDDTIILKAPEYQLSLIIWILYMLRVARLLRMVC